MKRDKKMNKMMAVLVLVGLMAGCSAPCGPRAICELTCRETAEVCSPEDFSLDSCLMTCEAHDLTEESVEQGRVCAECFVEQTQCNQMYLQEFCSEECFGD